LLGFGLIFGSVLSGHFADHILKKLIAKKGEENVFPEMRLRAVFPSFIGCLLYGWSTEKAVGVYAPFIGLFVCKFTMIVALL
jgi:hypothetical protein